MTSRIDVSAPATIFLSGTASSLGELPPDGIFVTDPASSGTLTVQLAAANMTTLLAAGSGGGATVTGNSNTLAITGSAAQVNAALATLQITEAAASLSDLVSITASDPLALSFSTAIGINIGAVTGPAFAAPPVILTLPPNTLDALPGLIIGDPQINALDAIGQGDMELMALTLSASSGVLFLPGLSALSGVSAQGLGTGTITLGFTADQLAAVNALLGGLEFAGPVAISGLAYAMENVSGPLGPTVTSGNIVLNVAGTAGANGSFATGNQTLLLGDTTLATASTLAVTTSIGALGSISGGGALFIAPDAGLNLSYDALSLGGTSLDFGILGATSFTSAGNLFIGDGAAFAGQVNLGTASLTDINGTLTADGAEPVNNQLAVSLAAGAIITGNGTIEAGNFSESGRISGAGTILVTGNDTLTVAAGSLTGGIVVDVQAGGVVELGPNNPLFGVFDATILNVDSSVTLAFSGSPGAAAVGGDYADALDQSGGVLVIGGPQVFSGTITGFAPGDRLIFPNLSNINVYNTTASGFSLAGLDGDGNTETYVIVAPHPAGTSLYAGTDSEGDAEISVRDSQNDVFLNGVTASTAGIFATANVAQPLLGLDVLMTTGTTLALSVTLAVGHGVLSDPAINPSGTITIAAANPTALNQALAGLTYTGTGVADLLTISSGKGFLSGLHDTIHISTAGPGVISNLGGIVTAAQTASFATSSLIPITGAAAPGEISISGTTDFAGDLVIGGIGGTALLVDGAATGMFDAGATVLAGGNVIIGDGGGAGTLAVVTDSFQATGNLILASASAAAGSAAFISGSIGVAGSIVIGASAAASLDLSGSLSSAAATIGSAGTLFAYANAAAAFSRFTDDGTATLTDNAIVSATGLSLAGTLNLGGVSTFSVAGGATLSGTASLQIGPDASFGGTALIQTGGAILDAGNLSLSGTLNSSVNIALAGGTLSAAAMTLSSGATLSGYGIVAPASLNLSGTVLASGGLLTLGGNVAGAGTIKIGTLATLDVVRGVSGGTVSFTGANAELVINDLSVFTDAVANVVNNDGIDLIGIAPAKVTFANGLITATDGAGISRGSFALGVAAGQAAVSIISDNEGGSLITLGGDMPCFARGTSLLTPNGYRKIETLKPGDTLITAKGDRRALRWIGHRTLDFSRAEARRAAPVLIMANAFGPGQPVCPLRLSPLHAVFTDGVLVPVVHLVNGATIIREAVPAALTYYHIELERHDIVMADGLPCETYLDTGNRGGLYHEAGTRSPSRLAVARRITAGPRLAKIRHGLHGIAMRAGFGLTYQPVLRVLANGQGIVPTITRNGTRRIAEFLLPPGTHALSLLSRSASPADTDPDSEDRRDVALCLDQAQEHVAFGAGWLPRAADDAGLWMGNTATLTLPAPASHLALNFVAVVQTWHRLS